MFELIKIRNAIIHNKGIPVIIEKSISKSEDEIVKVQAQKLFQRITLDRVKEDFEQFYEGMTMSSPEIKQAVEMLKNFKIGFMDKNRLIPS